MPMTPDQIAIVKSTVPILEVGGEALTTHFYNIMLSEHEEVRPLFNGANQRDGRQPRALAGAVLAYAKNIDALENIGPVASRIINKHVALQIQPADYAIVGACLLRAIREVLGAETATDAVIDAWGAAYGQLADILIGAEESMYKAAEQAEGGWRGARAFTVSKKVKESDVITSFYLTPVDGKSVLSYKAGQYLGLQVFVPTNAIDECAPKSAAPPATCPFAPSASATTTDAAAPAPAAGTCPFAAAGGANKLVQECRRNYSISQAANGTSLRISVKRHAKGVVSQYLHDIVKEGDVLNVFPPAGEFTLKAASAEAAKKPAVFIAAGVGITPFIPMLQQLVQKGGEASKDISEARLVHFCRSKADQAFTDEIKALVDESAAKGGDCPRVVAYNYYTAGAASANPAAFDANINDYLGSSEEIANAAVYLLGPKGFMQSVKKQLVAKGVPAENIAFEFFGPAEEMA